MALRVQFTPMLLASKLSSLEATAPARRPSAFSLSEIAVAPSGEGSPATPHGGSPASHSPPAVGMRERSHHAAMGGRPALIISPDADRRAITRAAAFGEGGHGIAEDSEHGGDLGSRTISDTSFAHRCGGGASGLAVSVPTRSLSRPNLGGPAILITSRPPSSQASSRPCSAASSIGSSRPSSANMLRGCPTPSSRPPVSQRRMIQEFDHKLSTVLPNQLLLGAEQSARDEQKLLAEGVTAIVNCAGVICANHFPHRFNYLKLNLLDTAREDISSVFYDALDFMDTVLERERGCVFVHCQHGVSRSSTLVIAYIMWKRRLSYDDALEFVRAARPTINPNIGFACALLQWGSSIEGPPSTLQAWALCATTLLGDSQTPMAGSTAAAALASGAASSSSAHESNPRAMRSVSVPACMHALTYDGGGFASEEDLSAAREAMRGELRLKGSILVLQRGEQAAVWMSSATASQAPAAEGDRVALERHLARLRKYHHLPERMAILEEAEGGESEEFWSLFEPPPTAPQPMGIVDPPALSHLAKSFTDMDLDAASQQAMPPQTCGRAHAASRPKRDFGAAASSAADGFEGVGAAPFVRPSLQISGPELSESSARSCSESDELSSTPGDRLQGSCGSRGRGGAGRLAVRTPSLDLGPMVRRASSYAVLAEASMEASPSGTHPPMLGATERARSEGRLDEMMAVTALQTVAYELLVTLQGPNAQTGSDGTEGASPALEEREELLSPLDLLLAYQQTITAQAHSSDEAHGILDALMGLLEQIYQRSHSCPPLSLSQTLSPPSWRNCRGCEGSRSCKRRRRC